MSKNTFFKILFALGFLILGGCNNNVTQPDPENSILTGSVKFLDGSTAPGALIQLQDLSNNKSIYSTADNNGVYEFNNLKAIKYLVKFKSTVYNISSFEKEVDLSSKSTVEQDVYILYNMLDDQSTVQKNDDVFLIKFQADGAKIGDNYSAIENITGSYYNDYSNLYTLSSDIYKCPNNINWLDHDSLFTKEYIINNFEFIMSIEEINFNSRHQIQFVGNDIRSILSESENGFAFVKKGDNNKRLKIPCVDRNNNDFGLTIKYVNY